MTTPIPVSRQPAEQQVALQQPQTFTDMQKKMENEMESRRMEWEKEVEKMQKDFFHLKTKDPADKSVDVAVSASKLPIRRHGTEIIDISNTKNLYTERQDGTKVYRLRFDVREFEPGEIHVKAEGHVLYISAEHHDEFGNVKKMTKQFSRQMDLPDTVDPDKIEANLSSDGILTVEAPVDKIPDDDPYNPAFSIDDPNNPNYPLMKAIEGAQFSNGRSREIKHFQGTTPGGVQVEVDPTNESYSYEHYLSGDYPEYPMGYSQVTSTEYPVYSQQVEYSSSQPGYQVEYSSQPGGYHVHHYSTGTHGGCACPHPWSRGHQTQHHSPHNRMRTHQNLPSHTSYSYSSPGVKVSLGGTGGLAGMLAPDAISNTSNSVTSTSIGPGGSRVTTTRYGSTSPLMDGSRTTTTTTTRYGSSPLDRAELESRLEDNLSSNMSMIKSGDSLASFGRYTNPLVVIVDGQRKLKLSVDIGTGFKPEEIEVSLKNNKLGVNASHEETVPWSSKRQFSREWDLPEDIEARTLRAALTDTGRIIMAASCKVNHDHDAVLDSIKTDMPSGGQYCRIKID